MRLRKLVAAAVPLPALLGLAVAVPAAAAPEPLVTLVDNAAPLAGSVRTGDLAADRPITAALSLKLHDRQALEKFLADVQNPDSPQYHRFLTPAQFAERFGPTQADVDRAVSFLGKAGATGIEVSGNRQAITFTGSAAQLESAFRTRIGTYHDRTSGRDFFANDAAPVVPAGVSDVVSGVVGLDNHAVRRHSSQAAAKPNVVKAVTPPVLKTAYGTSGLAATGSGVKVGFVEFDGYQKANISKYDSTYGLSAGSVTTVPVSGANYDSSPGDGQIEVELDIEVVHALAAAASDYVYEAPNTSAGELAMYQKIASDHTVNVVSISWGACESAEGSSAAKSVSNAIATGTAEGISYFAAAGDDGTTDCYRQTGSTAKAVDFPASSPNVTGVGGTQLTVTSSNAYSSEKAWNDGANGSTGGGISTVFTAPSWQSSQSTTYRKVPDVSADAASGSGYYIYTAGSWETVWGTSGAAPLWAAFATLQNQVHGGGLGNLNPKFYSIGNGSSYATGFHDVTTGNNTLHGTTGFTAGTKYDQVTGWGSFKGTGLSGLIG
ncbi:S53 family serine peptidase [Amycolatopsis sp. FBCC-B4732]|uniref:S53 family peptidase n=1 Tax=Amycolatopsis sp. FBCC-B4732 TaxID=3079339 RepID=UPI001FF67F30|nr:protease pro-enzyme activation domain-containing protein [Amycolatopsis sp. FBCC-B4732]UOX88032.1 S53 family serine peptidase [Amycolatopsis sp. FBCC-B4732]